MSKKRSGFAGVETEFPGCRASDYAEVERDVLFARVFPFAGSATASWGGEDNKVRERLGNVTFPNSCDSAVQVLFQSGVALLHSFWWQKGRHTFLDVLDHDPSCAIATWGIAAIDIGNPFAAGPSPAQAQQAQEAITRGRSIEPNVSGSTCVHVRFAERSHVARMKSLADAFETCCSKAKPLCMQETATRQGITLVASSKWSSPDDAMMIVARGEKKDEGGLVA